MRAALLDGARAIGVPLDDAQADRLLAYLALIAKWNRVYNLTAIRDEREMLTQHLLDSLAVVPALRRESGGQPIELLDVGSGAGLPGVVIAAVCPEVSVTCVDAVAKKVSFIQQAGAELGLGNLAGVHARVETMQDRRWRVITSRAFSSLAQFTELTRTLLTPDGVWMALKGKVPENEMKDLPASVAVFHVEHVTVPGLDAQRCIVWMRPSGD